MAGMRDRFGVLWSIVLLIRSGASAPPVRRGTALSGFARHKQRNPDSGPKSGALRLSEPQITAAASLSRTVRAALRVSIADAAQ